MTLLKFVCVFALIGVNKLVFAITDCTWNGDFDSKSARLKYRCNFVCDEQNTIEEHIFTFDDRILVQIENRVGSIDKSYISEISLKNCSFNGENTWQGEWNLSKLNASNNHLSEIPTNLLSGNITIEQLDISHNFIQRIGPTTFESVSSLLQLNLSHNNITNLHENAFDELINLKVLDLSFNPIENAKIETFSNLKQLEFLSLKHVGISSIQMGIFSHQHKLLELDLSENGLKFLDFEQNSPIFYGLRTLYLSKNELANLNGFRNAIFPQLTWLDITYNRFNCSYLQNFFNSIDFSKIHMPDDPQMTKIHETNIRGVNCKNINTTANRHENDGNASIQRVTQLNNSIENKCELKDLLQQVQNEVKFLKFTIVCLCIIVLVMFIVLLCRG